MASNAKSYNKIILKRKRRSFKRKFLLFLRILFIIIFFVGLVWFFNFFYNSQYFKIKTIDIKGNERYKESEIREKAEVAAGMNIFEIDKKYIEDKLLNELIWLKSVKLKKIFPDSISIEVFEREPFIRIVYSGKYYIIDKEGIVLDKIDKDSADIYDNLILVRNAVDYNPQIGEKIAKKIMLSCGEIYGGLDSKIKDLIRDSLISENYPEEIIFFTKDEKQIIFGSSKDLNEKNEILLLILDRIEKEKISWTAIDLRDFENPLIK